MEHAIILVSHFYGREGRDERREGMGSVYAISVGRGRLCVCVWRWVQGKHFNINRLARKMEGGGGGINSREIGASARVVGAQWIGGSHT